MFIVILFGLCLHAQLRELPTRDGEFLTRSQPLHKESITRHIGFFFLGLHRGSSDHGVGWQSLLHRLDQVIVIILVLLPLCWIIVVILHISHPVQ